jgi:hypothetical protein
VELTGSIFLYSRTLWPLAQRISKHEYCVGNVWRELYYSRVNGRCGQYW